MQAWTLLLLATALRLCAAPAPTAEPPAAPIPLCQVQGELICQAGQVSLVEAGASAIALDAERPLPYQIVALGPPALVTTCDRELEPVTWALGPAPQRYPEALPVLCQPPLTALSGLPTGLGAPELPLILLSTAGASVWRSDFAQILLPVAGEGEPGRVYLAVAQGGDPLTPLGEAPTLVKLDPATGAEEWQASLGDYSGFGEISLIGLSPHYGLLCLQYTQDYTQYLRFQRSDGALGPAWELIGQPHQMGIYPGPLTEMSGAQWEGAMLTVFVYHSDTSLAYRRFNLEHGVMEEQAAAQPPTGWAEENELPVGGDGAPGPAAPPFAQRLLPTADGADWRIPALRDGKGRVLVINAEGAYWLDLP